MNYHAHIYFDEETKETAENLHSSFNPLNHIFNVGKIHYRPVGPHTKPMFRLAFEDKFFSTVLFVLMTAKRKGLSILFHPETGNEILDHTENCLWMGEKVALDLSKL